MNDVKNGDDSVGDYVSIVTSGSATISSRSDVDGYHYCSHARAPKLINAH